MMIRGSVTIALGAALLVMGAAPAWAERAPPRPDRFARELKAQLPVAAPDAAPLRVGRDGGDTREAAVTRPMPSGPALPHPFREQVLAEARV